MAEQRSKEAPTTFQIKPFLKWCARTHTGLLDTFFTDTILLNRFNCLKRAVKIHTLLQYTTVQNQDIISSVTRKLILRGFLSTCARAKPLAPVAVAKNIIRLLFTGVTKVT